VRSGDTGRVPLRFLDKPVERVHLELTNRCVLACSRCSRTGYQLARRKGDLSLELVQKVIGPEGPPHLTVCGNYGDAIYHPRLHEVLAWIKQHPVQVDLTTNGSHRPVSWWTQTVALLDRRDRITFSIDGLEDTNDLYRINSRWSDVLAAVKTAVGHTRVRWKVIVFRHNEHQLDAIQELARELGVDQVRINKSARFRLDRADPLRPADPRWVGVRSRNQSIIKRRLKTGELDGVRILPNCRSGQEVFVSFEGKVYPCCSCAMFETSEAAEWFGSLGQINDLARRSLEGILLDPVWEALAEQWSDPRACPASCVKRCGVLPEFARQLSDDESIAKPAADNLKVKFKARSKA